MGAVARMMMVVALSVVPGGFVALFAYITGRALVHSWQRAAATPERKAKVLRETFSGVRIQDITREARAVLAM